MKNENFKKYLNEEIVNEGTYTENELGQLKKSNDVLINAQFKDDKGNSTKWFGVNDTESLMALKKFVYERLKMIKKGMK